MCAFRTCTYVRMYMCRMLMNTRNVPAYVCVYMLLANSGTNSNHTKYSALKNAVRWFGFGLLCAKCLFVDIRELFPHFGGVRSCKATSDGYGSSYINTFRIVFSTDGNFNQIDCPPNSSDICRQRSYHSVRSLRC